jgi:subtilase family serine protease
VVKPAALVFDPITPTVGSPVTITLTVTNSGEAPATDVIVEFVDSTGDGAEVIGRQMITGTLPAGRNGRARLVYDTTGKQGVRTVTVTADPDNTITESDETDNQTSGTFTLTQASGLTNTATVSAPAALAPAEQTALDQPNLVITNEDVNIFQADYVAVAAVDTNLVTITARLHNRGMVGAGNVVVQFVAMTGQGWQVIGEQQLGLVEAGAEASAEIAVDSEEARGYREVRVLLDPDNAIFEANEADNRASQVVRLGE